MKPILLFGLLFPSVFATAQNVGIGISNPSKAKLEVHGAVDATSAIFGGESSGISLQRNWPGIGYNSYYNNGHRYMSNGFGAVQFLDPINGYIAVDMFGNGTTGNVSVGTKRVMVVSKDGNLTLGSPNIAAATLEVYRNSGSSGTASFSGTTYNSHFNSGPSEHTHIRAGKWGGIVYVNDIPHGHTILSKFVSINGSDVDVPLYIKQSNGRGILLEDGESTQQWSIYVESYGKNLELKFNQFIKGFFRITDGSYVHVSDRRLKTNVQQLSPSLHKLLQLKPLQYEMIHNNPSHQRTIGFLAQDVQKLFPDLVEVITDTSNGKAFTDLHTLNYTGLNVVAIKAIQEQQQMIQSLQAQLAALQKTVNEMHSRGTGASVRKN